MSHEHDDFLASKREAWHGFTRLLLWGSVLAGITTLIATLFAI